MNERKTKRINKILNSEACKSKAPFSASNASSLIGINAGDTTALLREMVKNGQLNQIENKSERGTVTRYIYKTPSRKWLTCKW